MHADTTAPRRRAGAAPGAVAPGLLRRHPDAAVEPDHLTVQVAVAEAIWTTSRRTGRACPVASGRGPTGRGRCGPRRGASPAAGCRRARGRWPGPGCRRRQVAGGRQRHADDRTLRCRVGQLADLAVERGHRRRVDDDAALAVGLGLVVAMADAGLRHHVEGADHVELLDELEGAEVVRRPVPVDDPPDPAGAGAVDGDAQGPASAAWSTARWQSSGSVTSPPTKLARRRSRRPPPSPPPRCGRRR